VSCFTGPNRYLGNKSDREFGVIDAEWFELFMAHLYQNTARYPRFDPLRTQNYDISKSAVNEEYRKLVERIRGLIF
jgi:hypothetical protein